MEHVAANFFHAALHQEDARPHSGHVMAHDTCVFGTLVGGIRNKIDYRENVSGAGSAGLGKEFLGRTMI
jgi:hypothetical protein